MSSKAPLLTRRSLLAQAAASTVLGVVSGVRAAAEWKASKPIRLVVPWTPGGASDILARLAGNGVGTSLGGAIVVENKPGASGSIGSQAVSNAAPDGTTLVVAVTDSHSIYPHVQAAPIFKPTEQIAIAPLAIIPFCLLVRADLPINSLKEFIAHAKTKSLTYASWGNASAPHTATIMLGRMAGLKDMVHVPYGGTAPAIQAVMAGQVDFVVGPVAMAVTQRGKLKALAVMTPKRVEQLPDVPTFDEAGVPLRKDGEFWIGVFAPPKTPPNIVEALSQAFARATASPEYQAKLKELGMLPQTASAAEYARFFAADNQAWGKLVRDEKIEVN